jgi:hypothetical protein
VGPERLLSVSEAPPLSPDATTPLGRESLADLLHVVQALQSVPGRKIVALFSPGVGPSLPVRPELVALSAVEAHAVIYGFGLSNGRDVSGQAADLSVIDTLARLTGGAFVRLGKNIDRTMERALAELGACYVLEVEAAEPASSNRRHALRVTSPNRVLTLRAPAWVMPLADPGDIMAEPPAPEPAVAEPATPPVAAGPRAQPSNTTRPAVSSREAELQPALARLTAYVEAYQREYSALVAEENYRQSTSGPGSRVLRLRSDFLLVKPAGATGWTSFRDVFEVDGRPVRDREERLKRLFLSETTAALAQLQAIKEESARYNIGPAVRNINVPLFPLVFLDRANQTRLRFKLAGRHETAGVQAWRLEFTEMARPTLVRTDQDADVPMEGWFLVDPLSGAIVESGMTADVGPGARAELVVRYRRDTTLGLWVPAEMIETYRRYGTIGWSTLAEGRATYTNFRRFQVKTDTQITIPK